MTKPKVLVFSGYGFNCEEELASAFALAGARADIVHVNDLIDQPKKLKEYQVVAFPGGFAYGDDTGSGNAYARKVRNHLWEHMRSFLSGDRLVLGVCNGFQVLVNLGLVPAIAKNYGHQEVALLPNDSARYMVRWTDVESVSASVWLTGISTLSLPIAHGEGKLYAPAKVLEYMKKNGMIALRYVAGDICTYLDLPANPTGTIENIAGITDETGKVLGLMPHPERAIFFTQLPHWTFLKEQLARENKPIPVEGPGMAIFRNAVAHFS
jgi:phosphoribosylformylglycinamidine synthase subunit PurQ / glutaminase